MTKSKWSTIRRRGKLREQFHVAQDGKCFYCGRPTRLHPPSWGRGNPVPDDFATLEHLVRQVDGGSDEIDNIVMACFRCNVERGETDWIEWGRQRMAH